MKKSEFLEAVRMIYGRDLGAVESELLLPIVEKIKAWDPEETELPGEIYIRNNSALGQYGAVTRVSEGSVYAPLSPEELSKWMVAAAMLWNAWGPEGTLRKRLEAMNDYRLHALLAKPWEEGK